MPQSRGVRLADSKWFKDLQRRRNGLVRGSRLEDVDDFDVFVSYSSSDQKWADRLYQALSEQGFATWFDRSRLEPERQWGSEIKDAARGAHDIIVLVPRSGEPDEDQSREARAVLEAVWSDPDKRVIPVLMGKADPPGFLRSAVGGEVNAIRIEDPKRDWGRAMNDLFKVLKSEVPLEDVGEKIDTTKEDRKHQQERLSYIRDVADHFKE